MKKRIFLCCVILFSFFACGCEKIIELTDKENYLIAEYAAELLLKYDRNIDTKYYTDENTVTGNVTTSQTTENVTEELTEEVTEVTTEETTEILTEETQEATTEVDIIDNPTDEPSEEVIADADTSFDIAEFAQVDNVSIKYSHYMILDRYPSYDHEGMYIEIEAPDGYKLLILKFNVENKTHEEQNIDLYEKDIQYSIIVNDKRSAKQMLTILIDDLYTYQTKLEPSMRQEVVLLFQVSEEVAESIQMLDLRIEYGDEQRVIKIQ